MTGPARRHPASHPVRRPGEVLGIGACPFCGRLFTLRREPPSFFDLPSPDDGRREAWHPEHFPVACPCGASLEVDLVSCHPDTPADISWATPVDDGAPTSRFIFLCPFDGAPVEEPAIPWGGTRTILCPEGVFRHRFIVCTSIIAGPWVDHPCPSCAATVRLKVEEDAGAGELSCPGCGRRLLPRWTDWGRTLTLRPRRAGGT